MTECKMTQSGLAMALALTSHSSSQFSGVLRLRTMQVIVGHRLILLITTKTKEL